MDSRPEADAAPDAAPTAHRFTVSRRLLASLLLPTVILVVWTAQAQLPVNVLAPSGADSTASRALIRAFPQGWAFFTRTPREEQQSVYRLDGETLVALDRFPHAEPRNDFGLDRGSRKQSVELATLLHAVPEESWTECRATSLADCVRKISAAYPADNSQPNPTLCGPIVVAAHEPVPWAYRDLYQEPTIITRAAKLDVRCAHG